MLFLSTLGLIKICVESISFWLKSRRVQKCQFWMWASEVSYLDERDTWVKFCSANHRSPFTLSFFHKTAPATINPPETKKNKKLLNRKMEVLENLQWFCLQTKTNRALFLGQSPILTPSLWEFEMFNAESMKSTQTNCKVSRLIRDEKRHGAPSILTLRRPNFLLGHVPVAPDLAKTVKVKWRWITLKTRFLLVLKMVISVSKAIIISKDRLKLIYSLSNILTLAQRAPES